ncbi:MAG: conjugal transfer protein TraX [Butyrivibrio sp.]|nr:conjugal transfer protein TraX [Butyrivibrio sp.]
MHINYTKELTKIKIINADALKIIAIITMLIDHIGAGLLLYCINYHKCPDVLSSREWASIYYIMRHIGRIAFPIFCFLIVEGYIHTRSRVRYLRNLAIFSVISELFFDITFNLKDSPFEKNMFANILANKDHVLSVQNVYLTLFFGLLTIWLIDTIFKKLAPLGILNIYQKNYIPAFALSLFIASAIGFFCFKIHTDYSYHGIILICIFFILKDEPVIASILGYITMCYTDSEKYCLPAFILILLYNGKRGDFSKKYKFIFYIFYPLHLFIIYLIRIYLIK